MNLTEAEIEEYEERAGIMENEELMTRVEAEACAMHLIKMRRGHGNVHGRGDALCGVDVGDGCSGEAGSAEQ